MNIGDISMPFYEAVRRLDAFNRGELSDSSAAMNAYLAIGVALFRWDLKGKSWGDVWNMATALKFIPRGTQLQDIRAIALAVAANQTSDEIRDQYADQLESLNEYLSRASDQAIQELGQTTDASAGTGEYANIGLYQQLQLDQYQDLVLAPEPGQYAPGPVDDSIAGLPGMTADAGQGEGQGDGEPPAEPEGR